MNTYDEKKSLLLEMIAFSTVEGKLQKKEYDFLFIIANTLDIKKGGFLDLFQQELPKQIIRSEFKRVQQFYRLALLMRSEGVLHKKETNAIHQISLGMGLNPDTTKSVLETMEKTTNGVLAPEVLVKILKEQQN